MSELKCVRYDELKKRGEEWHEYCWPDTLFHNDDYPCKSCSVQKERYKTLLAESVKTAYLDKSSNIHIIKRNVSNHSGTIVQFSTSNDVGLLVGASATLEDYYYIWIDKDITVRLTTCVEGFKELNEIPANCSVLSYMMEKQRKDLLDKVMERMNKAADTDILITPITVKKIC